MLGCELDYPHAPVWCGVCWEDTRQARMESLQRETLAALKDRNEKLEEQLDLEYSGRRQPRREALPVQYPTKPPVKGGMSVQPRRTDQEG